MSVFVFLATGFEEIEAIAPIDIFRRANLDVVTVSISDTKEVCGAHGITVLADALFADTDFSSADLLFLPGGMPGTKNLDVSEALKQLILAQLENDKPVAAICAAPSILGKMGLLNDKEAICYPGFEPQLTGAILSENKIVTSGLIHTAKGAGVAIQFALSLVAELKGQVDADRIEDSICL
jgi:4-methyl-5(b-hydroxyethyl)-thiazole monophosphate biosynthesis